mmetsp:Transcript_57707/g.122460  ORF Transcript_57707/g.122460 Transcript_57707/m.122460 type:complete len:231 (-) Transcript_57707:63-755(-)
MSSLRRFVVFLGNELMGMHGPDRYEHIPYSSKLTVDHHQKASTLHPPQQSASAHVIQSHILILTVRDDATTQKVDCRKNSLAQGGFYKILLLAHSTKKGPSQHIEKGRCLGRRELGHSLGSLRHSMLGKLAWKHEANGGLNLSRGEGCLLVVGGELSSLASDAFEDVVYEGVHDGHSLLADACVGMDLLEDLVDVGGIGFGALLALLLLPIGGGLGGLGRSLLGGCLSHG